MSFLSLVLKNPFRSKSRALIVIISIAIGIACIIALGSITNGLTEDVDDLLHTGGSDFVISGKTSKSAHATTFGTDNINSSWVDTINNYPGINRAVGTYITNVIDTKNKFSCGLVGMNNNDIDAAEINISSGRVYLNDSNEVILGTLIADEQNKTVGDFIDLGDKTYKVVGLFTTGDSNTERSAFTSLETAQDFGGGEDEISMIYVKVDKGADVEKITDGIDSKYNESITTVKSLNDLESIKSSMDLLSASSWAISLLAVIIGSIGVINTMLMTVHERTKEIGLLKAIGWSNKRVLLMILGESVVTTIFGAIVGCIIAFVGVQLLVIFNVLSGITPVFTLDIILKGFIVAIVVGIVGGLYPAIRAVRLSPTKALGYD